MLEKLPQDMYLFVIIDAIDQVDLKLLQIL